MTKRKSTKGQTTSYKTIHIKLKIDPTKNERWIGFRSWITLCHQYLLYIL